MSGCYRNHNVLDALIWTAAVTSPDQSGCRIYLLKQDERYWCHLALFVRRAIFTLGLRKCDLIGSWKFSLVLWVYVKITELTGSKNKARIRFCLYCIGFYAHRRTSRVPWTLGVFRYESSRLPEVTCKRDARLWSGTVFSGSSSRACSGFSAGGDGFLWSFLSFKKKQHTFPVMFHTNP